MVGYSGEDGFLLQPVPDGAANYFSQYVDRSGEELFENAQAEVDLGFNQCQSPTWLKDSLNTTNQSSSLRKMKFQAGVAQAVHGTYNPLIAAPSGLPYNPSFLPIPVAGIDGPDLSQMQYGSNMIPEESNIFNAIDDAIEHFNLSLKDNVPAQARQQNTQKSSASQIHKQNESKTDSLKKTLPPNYISFQQKFQPSAEISNQESNQDVLQDSIHPWHQIERAQRNDEDGESRENLQDDSSVIN